MILWVLSLAFLLLSEDAVIGGLESLFVLL